MVSCVILLEGFTEGAALLGSEVLSSYLLVVLISAQIIIVQLVKACEI